MLTLLIFLSALTAIVVTLMLAILFGLQPTVSGVFVMPLLGVVQPV